MGKFTQGLNTAALRTGNTLVTPLRIWWEAVNAVANIPRQGISSVKNLAEVKKQTRDALVHNFTNFSKVEGKWYQKMLKVPLNLVSAVTRRPAMIAAGGVASGLNQWVRKPFQKLLYTPGKMFKGMRNATRIFSKQKWFDFATYDTHETKWDTRINQIKEKSLGFLGMKSWWSKPAEVEKPKVESPKPVEKKPIEAKKVVAPVEVKKTEAKIETMPVEAKKVHEEKKEIPEDKKEKSKKIEEPKKTEEKKSWNDTKEDDKIKETKSETLKEISKDDDKKLPEKDSKGNFKSKTDEVDYKIGELSSKSKLNNDKKAKINDKIKELNKIKKWFDNMDKYNELSSFLERETKNYNENINELETILDKRKREIKHTKNNKAIEELNDKLIKCIEKMNAITDQIEKYTNEQMEILKIK